MTEITIDQLSKTISKNTVLKDISMTMHSGRIYGLQGVNGSGKTMLMRSIIGLIHPTSGSISVNGKCLGKDIEFPESIGFLLENPAFLDGYSGFDNLKILTSIKGGQSDEQIQNMLTTVGLETAGKKKYRKYSLGMKQRLGIAAAVMENPDIIILDEPTNALDSAGVEMVKTILQEQKRRGALLIISCHDAAVLSELSDEIFQMENGRILKHLNINEDSTWTRGEKNGETEHE